MDKSGDVFVKVGGSVCLGAVESIGYGAFGGTVIGASVLENGKVESREGVAGGDEVTCYVVNRAVTVKSGNPKLGASADVLVEEELNSGYGNVAADVVGKVYRGKFLNRRLLGSG